jgi:hypothetical protein
LKMTRKLLNRLFAAMGDDGGDAGGGNAPSGGDAIGTGNDARIALLNQIGDSYDELRAEDLADITDDGSTEPFKVQRPDGEEEPLVGEPEVAAPEPEDRGLDTAQMITRKVNGKLVTKPLEDWLVDASKVNAADEYLQDAARARKQALQPEPEAQAPQQPAPQRPDPQEVAQRERDQRRQLARAIQMGTEEEAVAALETLQNMSRTPTLTVEDVGRVADERLKFNTAISTFNKDFSDLVSNPQLHAMVLKADQELISQGDKRPYAERYTDIGNQVRAWRDDLIKSVAPTAPAAEPTAPASLDQRRAAKAAAPKAPTAASKTAQAPVEDNDDEDVGSVIASMAKARGGPQWARG